LIEYICVADILSYATDSCVFT